MNAPLDHITAPVTLIVMTSWAHSLAPVRQDSQAMAERAKMLTNVPLEQMTVPLTRIVMIPWARLTVLVGQDSQAMAEHVEILMNVPLEHLTVPLTHFVQTTQAHLLVLVRQDSQQGGEKINVVYENMLHIHVDEWLHVAFTWSREGLIRRLYINGFQDVKQRVLGPSNNLDLNPTGHTVFDIGLKRDSQFQSTFNGYLRDLMVFDTAITGLQVKNIFVDNYTEP
ncbi:hypothetical protein AWC38_SpisGene3236 [Stylophora pistillata]|uniref:LamG domain-containing protein n=1 Tax=Stylophora pistillata TaxID=50429 RepID=A0A2B4STR0_STYPI|nr:hypothetical protein AWC38_SpisGene3236 [Stylophora pistillata]